METDEFIERIRTEAGLPPASFVDSGLVADQSHRTDTLILDLATRFAAEELLSGALPGDAALKDLSLFFLWSLGEDGEHIGRSPLPPDFLRLGTLRMDSWKQDIHILHSPGDPEWELRNSPAQSLAGCSASPRGYLFPSSKGKIIEVRSCQHPGEKVAEGFYLPVPDFSGERTPEIGRATMEKVITRVCSLLRQSA